VSQSVAAGHVVPIEETACQVAVDPDRLAAVPLSPEARAAIENAEADTETVERRCVRCSTDQARDLLEYFDRVAATLQLAGDYERSTSCAQAAEQLRRTLEGPVLT
jgi:hypothetical protein